MCWVLVWAVAAFLELFVQSMLLDFCIQTAFFIPVISALRLSCKLCAFRSISFLQMLSLFRLRATYSSKTIHADAIFPLI
jgi:hypothetical protein